MTTDNRTNVQIVADALRSMPEAERDDDRDPAVVVAEYAVAALVAAQGAAPVLPSSGVDEDALAEVIEQARDRSRKDRDIAKESLGQYIARIVNERRAEWLRGTGGADE